MYQVIKQVLCGLVSQDLSKVSNSSERPRMGTSLMPSQEDQADGVTKPCQAQRLQGNLRA